MKDLSSFTGELFTALSEELSIYADLGTLPVKRVTGAIASIQKAITGLKSFVDNYAFKSQAEEIHFFKYEKPRFTAEHCFAMEIFTIETARPLHDTALLKAYYEQQRLYIRRFLDTNKFLYAYYQFDMAALDHLLFVRGAKPSDIPLPDDIGLDPAFSTCCDSLWGKFMAFERLEEWLQEEMETLQRPQIAGNTQPGTETLTWTGSVVNLAELAYGIWLTGQVNKGNASISQIAAWLETHLHIRIGRPHRRWETIAARKRLSLTKFLDQMAEAIRQRLDDENS